MPHRPPRHLSALCLALAVLAPACERPCAEDADCPLPARCGADLRCVIPAPAEEGEPCRDDLNCLGGACVFTGGQGRCGTACAQLSDCPSGRCATRVDEAPAGPRLRLVCGPAGGERFLAEFCASDGQCRSGLCHDAHCSAPCGACPEPLACAPASLQRGGLSLRTGVCTWWPVQPVVELGPVDTVASGPARLELEVPAGFGAFTVVLEDAEDLVPAVTRLVAPDDVVFLGNPRAADAGSTDLARLSAAPGTSTVLVPGSDDPRAVVAGGRWRLEVATFARQGFPTMSSQVAGRLERVAAVLKRPERGGVVDLTLRVAPETGLAPADGGAWVPAVLERLDGLLRDKLGVTLGQVAVDALPPDAGDSIPTLARAQELWAAHSASSPTARAINVLVVRELAFAAGVTGTSPGAPGVYGRPASGIILRPLATGAQATGVLLGHELGHHLGLFHTSDDFFGPDLVRDTPACARPSQPGCPDERHLMFPFFPTREPLPVSDGQARVLEGSPWVYHWRHPGACGPEVDVVGLSSSRFASGALQGPGRLSGACGGPGGERVHLLRLEETAGRLEVAVTGQGFNPVLSVRQGSCQGPEVACVAADGGTAALVLPDAGPGAYFVVVDSLTGADGGTFRLGVNSRP